ncbi:MAG TPA: hypothetical protein VHP34_11545 [Alphaproteobacteria bacterium]|nr:hypothetical protein [Alphaproteobacteria bacterium]
MFKTYLAILAAIICGTFIFWTQTASAQSCTGAAETSPECIAKLDFCSNVASISISAINARASGSVERDELLSLYQTDPFNLAHSDVVKSVVHGIFSNDDAYQAGKLLIDRGGTAAFTQIRQSCVDSL